MKNFLICISLTVVILINSSCIHTAAHINETVVLNQSDTGMNTVKLNNLELKSYIYSQSKWPMEDFFKNMTQGEIATAFKKFDLKYQSANHQNHIINELLNDGFVPVYVKIKNQGEQPIHLNEKMFALKSDDRDFEPLIQDQIPRAFDRFNQKALAANIYNAATVTAGIIGFFVVIAVVAVSSNNQLNLADATSTGPSGSGSGSGNDAIFNSLNKKTHLDYKDYVLNEHTLRPNETIEKLLFFKTKAAPEKMLLTFNSDVAAN